MDTGPPDPTASAFPAGCCSPGPGLFSQPHTAPEWVAAWAVSSRDKELPDPGSSRDSQMRPPARNADDCRLYPPCSSSLSLPKKLIYYIVTVNGTRPPVSTSHSLPPF